MLCAKLLQSCLTLCNPMDCSPPGSSGEEEFLLPRRDPSWDSPGKNTGVGSLSLFQGIFPTQGLNWSFLHCRWILYQLSYQGNPNWWLTMVLICLSLMTNDVTYLFIYLLTFCIPSGEMSVLLLLVRLACFLTVRF